MEGFQTLKGSWPWPWPSIRPYGIPSCITRRPLPIYQLSFKLKKLFVDGRTYGRTDGWTDGQTFFPSNIIRSTFRSRPKNDTSSIQLKVTQRVYAALSWHINWLNYRYNRHAQPLCTTHNFILTQKSLKYIKQEHYQCNKKQPCLLFNYGIMLETDQISAMAWVTAPKLPLEWILARFRLTWFWAKFPLQP